MAKETTSVLTAVLHGSKAPTPQQLQRFTDFLTAKYHQPVQLTFEQNDALAAAAQSVDAELSGCCSTIAQFINNPDLKKYASATERDLQAEVELTYYIYLSTENNPDLVNYYL